MQKKKQILTVALIAMINVACSKDDSLIDEFESSENSIEFSEEQLEKIAYGCDTYFDDTMKVETQASTAYMDYIISDYKSVTAQSTLKAAKVPMVGVIKHKTCGSYDELTIIYDCENKKNNNHHNIRKVYLQELEATGGFKLDDDLTMTFCIVPFEKFKSIGRDYALLVVGDSYLKASDKHTFTIDVHLDADDKANNSFTQFPKGKSFDTKPTIVDRNMTLRLVYFPKQYHAQEYMPDLGIGRYSVFGNLNDYEKSNCTWFYTDDEDSNNANWNTLYCDGMNIRGFSDHYKYDGTEFNRFENYVKDVDYTNIFEQWKQGTQFYISYVKNPGYDDY